MATTAQAHEPANGTGWWIAPAFVEQDELPRTLVVHREALIQAAIGGVAKCRFNCLPGVSWSKIVLAVAGGGSLKVEVPNRALRSEPPTEEQTQKLQELLRGNPDREEELRARPQKTLYLNGGAAKRRKSVHRAVARR